MTPRVGRRRRARQGIASVWRSAGAAFVSRAHPLRVLLANPALLARPGVFRGPPRAEPAPFRSQYSATELSLLPALSMSSTPRGVAPPCPRVHPRNLRSVCSPFPSLLPSSSLGARAPHGGSVSPPSHGHLRAPCRPPANRRLRPGLGVARPDSAPSRGLARSQPGLSPGAGRRHKAASSSVPAHLALPLSRSPRRARSRPARSELRLLPAPVSAVTALGNMATEGMILTNHDHQIRVGVLTGNRRKRSGTATAAVLDLPHASCLW